MAALVETMAEHKSCEPFLAQVESEEILSRKSHREKKRKIQRKSPFRWPPANREFTDCSVCSDFRDPPFWKKSVTGTTLPVWLTSPGPVLLRKHVRSNKYSSLVERVHLLNANPQYAYVVLPDGREDTVSIRDLVPAGAADNYPEHSTVTMNPVPEVTPRTPSPTQTPHDTHIPGASYAYIPGASREGSLTPSGLTPPVRPEPAQPPSPVQAPPAPVNKRIHINFETGNFVLLPDNVFCRLLFGVFFCPGMCIPQLLWCSNLLNPTAFETSSNQCQVKSSATIDQTTDYHRPIKLRIL
ncbi:uncharacterized protein [Hemitrygon akajei]|uniref:uncharacterized protein n=1 Tax=Hemitrygon akajei TaxID=2704970 RepID=UPI003BF9EF76